jgi:hypothetical protein
MVIVLYAAVSVGLVVLVACGGSTKRADPPDGSSAGDASGGKAQGGSSSSTGGSGGDSAGSGGSNVISGEPESCTTSSGERGMIVDIFPFPAGSPPCVALDQPGELDPDCPSDSLYVCDPIDCYEAADLRGCCRPDGMCGLLEEGYFSFDRKLGCVSREPWIEQEDKLGRDLEPVACKP